MNLARETKFENFGFTCPNCGKYYTVFNGNRGIPSEEQYNRLRRATEQQIKLGYCKNCKRKHPDIPTTLEMDGIISKIDIDNRYQVVLQCRDCKNWTQMKQGKNTSCTNCSSDNFDTTSMKSLRTYNPTTDNKRKPKIKK